VRLGPKLAFHVSQRAHPREYVRHNLRLPSLKPSYEKPTAAGAKGKTASPKRETALAANR
jgi:hypothetical protein